MGLSQKCMTINLSMSRWSGCKVDPKASKRHAKDSNAEDDAVVVSKRLMPKEAFAEITTAWNALRAHRDKHTLPWSDKGPRIMTRNIFELFMSGFGELERSFNDAVEEFVTVKYPPVRDRAAFRMGDLFDERDYPTPDKLREKFGVNLDIDGITEPNDFRVDLPEQELEKVKATMEESISRRLGEAMRDVYVRIANLIEHYIEKMDDEDAIFRDSTVNNLVELMGILPGLNVTNDPNLRAIRQRVMGTIGAYSADDLRKDDGLRATAAHEAKSILEELQSFVGGR